MSSPASQTQLPDSAAEITRTFDADGFHISRTRVSGFDALTANELEQAEEVAYSYARYNIVRHDVVPIHVEFNRTDPFSVRLIPCI